MNKDRVIAILLFSSAALVVWFSYIIIQGVESINNWMVAGGALSAVVATSIITHWLSPTIYKLEPSKRSPSLGASYGIVITILSFFLGAVILGVGMTIVGSVVDDSFTFIRAFQSFFLVAFVGFFTALIYMSPGIIVGGITGIIYHYILNKNPEQLPNKRINS